MKKLNILFILAAGLTLASSCNRDEAGLNPPEQKYGTVTITADAARTKTVLDGGAVKWEDGDEIALRFTHDTKEAVVGKFATSIEAGSAATADFTGTVASDVLGKDGGYDDAVHAVYPYNALTGEGVVFALPASQQARDNGAFAEGLNLASAALSLEDIRVDGKASGTFLNALSILRFSVTGSDVTSVTLTGTAPLAGAAPVVFSDGGRLVIEADADWAGSDKEMSVTLTPADGSDCFTKGTVYNLLVWPGTHSSLTATLNFKEYGAFDKTSAAEFTFEPSKYYTLDFNADSETLVKEITDPLDAMDLELPDLEDRLAALETTAEKISMLLDQIQSVALMSEYLENSAYAYYAKQTVGMLKLDVKLTYMVRPAAAMELLLEICKEEGNLSEVLSMMCDNGAGSFSTLNVKDAILEGDILTVLISGDQFDVNFYDGRTKASVALQISDGNTDIISDFASLIPKVGTILNLSRVDDIPVLKGASFSMSYQYGAEDYAKCQVSVSGVGFSTAPTISADSGNGFIRANFDSNADLSAMSMTVTLKYDGEVADVKTLTFADGGTFSISTPASVDYIGGEVAVDVTSSDFSSYSMQLSGAGDWIYETNSGVSGRYTLNQNNGLQRSANVVVTITNGNISYSKSVTITQKATGTSLTGNYYYNGEKLLLNQKTASCANALNIVILGDGYQKKDLLKGGKFERSARSAMDSFFGVEPYKTFKDRFNVYMVAYESPNEGPRLESVAEDQHVTYFGTWYKGAGNTLVGYNSKYKIQDIVQNTVGLDTNEEFYRTIVILLVNSSESLGSTDYPVMQATSTLPTGEGYASFAIAILAANSQGTSGLVRHEAGGHAFGRLGDEYPVDWYTVSLVNERHGYGFYRNVATNTSYWSAFTNAGYGSDKVTYDSYGSNELYRSTHESGIMWNNNGNFNAVSRHAIYERIINQTEGSSAYSWQKFLEYDKRNIQ